jgi:hypothetical protein
MDDPMQTSQSRVDDHTVQSTSMVDANSTEHVIG